MLNRVKHMILGTVLETFARQLYIRFDPSEGGKYDREALAIMRRCLSRNSNCIDIGAHRGSILSEIVGLSPAGAHYAFEPVPENYQYLVKTFPKVKVFPLALGNTREKRSFTHVIDHPTRSGFFTPVEAGETAETIQVDTDLLDNIIPPDLPVHLIKLDVEGAEFQVLQGGRETIARNRPLIVFEHGLYSRNFYHATSGDVFDMLSNECGLKVSLLKRWLEQKPALEREKFITEVEQGRHYYFVAYP